METRKMILIVDDSPDALSLLTETLGASGFTVKAADSGELALASITVKLPDLILLDIRMPNMDGFEVCRQLKANPKTHDIPVIMITADNDVQGKVKGFRLGAADYVTKPFQAEELLSRINNHLTISSLTNELKNKTIELEQRVAKQTEELRRSNEELQQDIADRKQAEENLAKAVQYLTAHMENSPLAVIEFDPQFRVNRWSKEAENVFGWTSDEVIGRSISEFQWVYEEDEELVRRESAGLVSGERSRSLNINRNYRKDGSIIHCEWYNSAIYDSEGKMISILSQVMNVTRRKEAEEALRKSEERFAQMADQAHEMIWDVDAKGLYTYVSSGCELITGYRPGQLIEQMHFYDLHPEEGREPFKKTVFAAFERKESFSGLANPILTKDGRKVWVSTNGMPILDIQGSLIGYRGSNYDITDRLMMEEKKAELENQNRQLQKAESLGRMAASIAHTFNNQLGAVIGNLELAIDDLPRGSELFKSLTAAMQAAQKSAEVSRMMLTYLGQSFDKCERLDLSEVCRRNQTICKAALPGNVALEISLPSSGPVVMASEGQIQQIAIVLITNAGESMGKNGGTIHLSVKTVSPADIPVLHRRPVVWQPQECPYACMEVTDTGCGIEDKDIENLYDPFFTSKFIGRGLGLPVALGIVKAHNGAITVESKPGEGSTFRVFLPVSAEENVHGETLL